MLVFAVVDPSPPHPPVRRIDAAVATAAAKDVLLLTRSRLIATPLSRAQEGTFGERRFGRYTY